VVRSHKGTMFPLSRIQTNKVILEIEVEKVQVQMKVGIHKKKFTLINKIDSEIAKFQNNT
jgi:hypothetical protein